MAFILAMLAASIYGWVRGDPKKLLLGWDSDLNGCGYSPNALAYPYLYFPAMPNTE